MSSVEWRSIQFTYTISFEEAKLTYTKRHRFAGVVPHSLVGWTVKLAKHSTGGLEAGEARVVVDLAQMGHATTATQAVKSYSAFSEPFLVIAGAIAAYFTVDAVQIANSAAWVQWGVIIAPFAATYMGLRWILSNIFKHKVIVLKPKVGKDIALDVHGIDNAGLDAVKAGLKRFVAFSESA